VAGTRSRLPLILLPPSEGKAPGGDGPPWSPGAMAVDLDEERLRVATALGRAMAGGEASRGRLLGVRGAALATSTDDDRRLLDSPTLPAIRRYTGVLYDALDAGSLPAAARRRLGGSVLIVSGLWGLVAPGDRLPAYRLKMSASLPGLGRLSTWWRPALTAALGQRAAGRQIWDLLPQEHAAAWSPPPDLERTTVQFLEERPDGQLAAVSHWNKLLKGALVRHLLEHPATTPEGLADWEHPAGYRPAPDLTEVRHGLTTLRLVRRR
jgi:uncharacterized protein